MTLIEGYMFDSDIRNLSTIVGPFERREGRMGRFTEAAFTGVWSRSFHMMLLWNSDASR